MLNKTTLSIAFALICSTLAAQIKDYSYKFEFKGLKAKDTVYLANYYGKNLYYFDTAYVNGTSVALFKKKKELRPGIFAVVIPGGKRMELVIAEPAFSATADTSDLEESIVYTNSRENTEFERYKKTIGSFTKRAEGLKEKGEKGKSSDALKALDKEVKDFQLKFMQDNKDLLIGQYVTLLLDVEIPEFPKNPDGSRDSISTYYYYRDHYFDRVNLKNDYMTNTALFANKLEYWMDKIVLQHPDTIVKMTRFMTDKMVNGGDLYKYTVEYVTTTYNKSKIIGMDAVFVGLAHEYFLAGKTAWVDTARMRKIKEYVAKTEPLLLGKPAHPLSLVDTTMKNWKRLYDMKDDIIVLVFWEPSCGHCKKAMPILAEYFNKTKGKDFGVYAVSPDSDADWTKFIHENKMEGFTNVTVLPGLNADQPKLISLIQSGTTDLKSLNYKDTYDVYSTPTVYILDKNKKILLKQVSVEQIEELITDIKKKESLKKG